MGTLKAYFRRFHLNKNVDLFSFVKELCSVEVSETGTVFNNINLKYTFQGSTP